MFLMSDILDKIRTLAVMELGDLADDETSQNAAIFGFTTVALRKRAKQANNIQWSDTLNIASNGYQSFLTGGSAINDLYQPVMVWDVSGARERQTNRRSSFDLGNGWYREAENTQIHTYGLTGNHKLQYIRYPAAVTSSSSTVEFPLAGQMDLIMDVVALIKLPKNMYEEYGAVKAQATGVATVKAAIDAVGRSQVTPTLEDREG